LAEALVLSPLWKPTLLAACLLGAGLAGRVADVGQARDVEEIRMWVEPMAGEIHPGVNTTVRAFCAEGEAVEPVHGDQPCGVPGPTIRVQAGDRVRLTFENTHSIDHTVHLHGWHGFGADMNGVELVDDAMVTEPGEGMHAARIAREASSETASRTASFVRSGGFPSTTVPTRDVRAGNGRDPS
jgi:plastocyanin